MRVAAVVQARLSSSRLPGKVLRELAGKPMLLWLLERLERAGGVDEVIVATSAEGSDDPLAAFCEAREFAFHRGSLDDVAGRMLDAARAVGAGALVRATGDSPFLDQRLIAAGVERIRASGAEVVTNVFPRRTAPPGQSVEVVTLAALERALPLMVETGDHEHVTQAIYRERERFEIEPLDVTVDPRGESLAVDTAEDARRAEAILRAMERPHWEYTAAQVVTLAASLRTEAAT